VRQPSLLADLEEFLTRHRPHGELTADCNEPNENGYLLEVACSCGVVFGRWITLEDAAIDVSRLGRLN
jgi:hypothetical protein